MVLIPQWRQLIYKLADKYPSCLMLNFAIKVGTANCMFITKQCITTASNKQTEDLRRGALD